MRIQLTEDDRRIAELFADAREENDSSFYKRRGGFKREDIVCGALAEIAAFKYLFKKGLKVNFPDFTIHKKKSFSADLSDGENFFHVKGQTTASEKKYGCSYLFQKSDKLVTSPKENSYIICCVADLNTNEVEIKADLAAADIVWGAPKIKWLERTKVAFYLEDQCL